MKALPKRKGNQSRFRSRLDRRPGLNESPSEKEGKFQLSVSNRLRLLASMKALPKRKGNPT